MITLKRLNVVKIVDSEEKAQALIVKGFERVVTPAPKPKKSAGAGDKKAADEKTTEDQEGGK